MKIVYLITNTTNGKVYVGKDSHGPKTRWGSHIRALKNQKHSNTHLQHAWNKYGNLAWSYKILKESKSVKEMNLLETYYITEVYHSNNPKFGYNQTTGGEENKFNKAARKKLSENNSRHWRGKKFSEEHCRKISESKRGTPSWNKGKSLTIEHKQHLSEQHADMSGKNHPMYGKHHTAESKKKLSVIKRNQWLSGTFKDRVEYDRSKIWTAEKKNQHAKRQRPNGYPAIVNPAGKVYRDIVNFHAFCDEHNLNYGNMWMVVAGKKNQCTGWRLLSK